MVTAVYSAGKVGFSKLNNSSILETWALIYLWFKPENPKYAKGISTHKYNNKFTIIILISWWYGDEEYVP